MREKIDRFSVAPPAGAVGTPKGSESAGNPPDNPNLTVHQTKPCILASHSSGNGTRPPWPLPTERRSPPAEHRSACGPAPKGHRRRVRARTHRHVLMPAQRSRPHSPSLETASTIPVPGLRRPPNESGRSEMEAPASQCSCYPGKPENIRSARCALGVRPRCSVPCADASRPHRHRSASVQATGQRRAPELRKSGRKP
jgi:hypothetical protein